MSPKKRKHFCEDSPKIGPSTKRKVGTIGECEGSEPCERSLVQELTRTLDEVMDSDEDADNTRRDLLYKRGLLYLKQSCDLGKQCLVKDSIAFGKALADFRLASSLAYEKYTT